MNDSLAVTLLDPSLSSIDKVLRLPDPGTGDERLYLQSGRQIAELQVLDNDYRSFMLENQIVGGTAPLYIATRMDPLFWVLAAQTTLSEKRSWQPIDQVLTGALANLSSAQQEIISRAVDDTQLRLLMAEMEVSEDERFYRFCPNKALAWLDQKREALTKVLHRHDGQASAEKSDAGAFAAGFNCLDENKHNRSAERLDTAAADTKRQAASLQVVCNYLNNDWTIAYLQHCQLEKDVLEDAGAKRAREATSGSTMAGPASGDWNAELTLTVTKKAKVESPKQSAALKKLAKVNTKGMKKMSAFFQVKK